jgi:hypothetical protein
MATKIGPKTVSQRDRSKALVFCIDAAHPDSYAGQPATNLLPSDISHANWVAYAVKNVTTLTNGGLDGKSDAYILTDSGSGQYQGVMISLGGTGAGSSLATSTLYTFSVWVKQKPASEDTNRTHFRWYEGSGGGGYMSLRIRSGAPDGPVVDSGRSDADDPSTTGTTGIWETARDKNGNLWFRAYYTWTTKSSMSGGQSFQLLPAHDGATTGSSSGNTGSETIWCPQLEVGDCPTPAVGPGLSTTTARSASTAVKNISGLGALGTTLTGTFATYGNKLRSKVGSRKVNRGTIAAGNIGGAYWDFDGSDEYIDTGLQPDFIHTNATLIMWTRMADITAGYAHGNHNNKRFYMGTAGGYLGGGVQNQNNLSSHSGKTSLAARGISNSDWFMGTVVADSGTAKMYVNGDLDSTFSYTQSSGSNPDGNFRIGNWQNSSDYWWNGEVATCMIWSAALTTKEIKDIYIAQKGRFGK